jgi:hypothetical protein
VLPATVVKLHDLAVFASCDWGFNSPGCFLWWVCLPDGHLHIVQEYKFSQTSAELVADRVKLMTRDVGVKRLQYVACDPSMKAKTGHGRGESIMETLQRKGLPMRPSDNDRVLGWLRVHELLQVSSDGTPWLTIEPTCKYLIRSIPAQMSDKKNPDDIDTGGDDHAVDALRYGAMSRPSPLSKAVRAKVYPPMSLGALTQQGTQARMGVLAR